MKALVIIKAPIGMLALAACLSGCAGYRAYQQGQEALAEGRVAEGMEHLRVAAESSPGNTSYRREYYTKRDQMVGALSRQGELALDRGDVESAQNVYAQIVQIQPDAAVGSAGLNRVEGARRHQKLMSDAVQQADANDLAGALSKVQQVLSENASHRGALALHRKLQRQQADTTGKELGIYPKLKSIYRTPVSLSFSSASLRQVFESLKLASGLNYVFDKDLPAEGRVSIAVTDKPVEDVLRLLLATNQLESRVLDGDTLLIYPNTVAKAADYREMVVRSFYVSNADINKTAAMIKAIAKAKDVFIDERVNLLVVRDSAEVIRLAERLIASQDMPEPEVMLELEVLEVSVNRLLSMGIRWPNAASATVQGARGAGTLTLPELKEGSESLVSFTFNNPLLAANLSSQKGDANLLANPRVRVRNKQAAKILIGEKVPVITTSATANVGTSESVSYLDVGLKLDIEPTVALDDEVTMKLSLEVSNILETLTRTSGTQTYRLGTRNTSTTLRVRDGETNVLAGLIQKEDRKSNTGIPGLNELPLVSKLFGSATDSDTKTEIVLLITPRIVRNLDLPGVGQQEFLAGTENAIGAAPIQLGTALPAKASTVPPVSRPALAPPMPVPPMAPTPTTAAPPPAMSPAPAGAQQGAPADTSNRRYPPHIQKLIDSGMPPPPGLAGPAAAQGVHPGGKTP
jgi:general secretion pathway protein D